MNEILRMSALVALGVVLFLQAQAQERSITQRIQRRTQVPVCRTRAGEIGIQSQPLLRGDLAVLDRHQLSAGMRDVFPHLAFELLIHQVGLKYYEGGIGGKNRLSGHC